VVESKGIRTVIEALPLLSRYIEHFRLLVAGGGDRRFLAALRLADPSVVKILGRLPFQEMRSVFASADLTVVPSVWYENSPVVIHESLLAGTPVLGSDIGGIPELVQTEATGYVFPPGDASALAERAIMHFGRSAFERRAMRQRCTDYARTYMAMDRHLGQIQRVYAEALDGRVYADGMGPASLAQRTDQDTSTGRRMDED
jgi:glycosyltransferase involved in cell wall biosynthesis